MAETWTPPARAAGAVARSVFDRLLPAALFGAMALARLRHLAQLWTAPVDATSQAGLVHLLALGHGLLLLMFWALLTLLFVIRRTPMGGRAAPLAMGLALAGTFVMWIALAQPTTTQDWRVLAAADLLMIVGLAFSLYALGALGTCFGLAPEARGLVTTGAYRLVRHPVYLGEFVIFFGALLPVLAPFTALIFGLFCLLQARRAMLEEVVLSATFADYAAYRRRTPALLPWARFSDEQRDGGA